MDSGLTTYSVQYTICVDGIYGPREWTTEEREVACKEFKRMTGVTISPNDNSPNIPLIVGLVVIGFTVGIVAGYTFFMFIKAKRQQENPQERP